MKKILIFYILIIVIFISCSTKEKMVVEGVAIDAKAGAIVITSNDSIYYVEGVERWEKSVFNHKVRVTGYLERIVNDPDSLFYFQGMYKQNIIHKPRVKIIE